MNGRGISRCGAGVGGRRLRPRVRWLLRGLAPPGVEPEAGNAPVEFIGWTVVLVVPVVYLLIALAQVQAASFAVASAVDAASRILEVERGEVAVVHARTAVGLALSDQGLDVDPASAMTVACADTPCSAAVVRVETGVDLPLLAWAGVGRDVVVIDAERSVTLAGTGDDP
ncbi:peptidase T4 [Actinomyces qiguomingii]|uniref:peptidase T4 n=1 Tax=Actinomyces qiguomingii TaxID=2057800 RepID=UPI001E60BAFF|nr:peptidase T4 [Actinomyces qiguomingii]